jgi:hypothetical protein
MGEDAKKLKILKAASQETRPTVHAETAFPVFDDKVYSGLRLGLRERVGTWGLEPQTSTVPTLSFGLR